jgi:basic amino acid/polyamine antiporter, APA family
MKGDNWSRQSTRQLRHSTEDTSVTPPDSKTDKQPVLKRTLSLFDATAISVGAIIGAGIFVVTGIVAGLAGSALVISVLIAGLVALFTALSTAELAARLPEEGGIYDYADKMISPFIGFMSGWMWAVSNTLAGAAVALGFSYYLTAAIPVLPLRPVAAVLCLAFTWLNYSGAKHSASVNNVMVVTKLAVLAFFVIVGALNIQSSNLAPFNPFSSGTIYGAYYIFFAFSGFARVTIVAGEVKDAARTVPRAIFLSLAISTAVYLLVGFVAVGLAGPLLLRNSSSPLAAAIEITGNTAASRIVSLGALVATATVLLTSILGVSRMLYAMTLKGQLPRALGKLHESYGTPYYAIWLTGSLMALLTLFTNLGGVVAISTFASLFYYIVANIAAFRIKREDRRYPRAVPVLGVLLCTALLVFSIKEAPLAWVIGGVSLAIGAAFYKLRRTQMPK